jgi:hypothetical protein
MATLVTDSALNANEEGTFMVNPRLIFVVNAGLSFVVSATLTAGARRIDPGKSTA